jgi:hypothetical protein
LLGAGEDHVFEGAWAILQAMDQPGRLEPHRAKHPDRGSVDVSAETLCAEFHKALSRKRIYVPPIDASADVGYQEDGVEGACHFLD